MKEVLLMELKEAQAIRKNIENLTCQAGKEKNKLMRYAHPTVLKHVAQKRRSNLSVS